MKGKMSKDLLAVLRDPAARAQLREHLINSRDGHVTVGSRSFSVRTDANTSAPAQAERTALSGASTPG